MGVTGTKMPRYFFGEHVDPVIKRQDNIDSFLKEREEESRIMLCSPEFFEDLKTCIDGRVKRISTASGINEEYCIHSNQNGL